MKALSLLFFSEMIGMKKLQLFTQLHLSEQSWLRTAEHCSIYLSSKVATYVLFNILIIFLSFVCDLVLAECSFFFVCCMFSKGHRVSKHHHSVC